MSIKGKVTVGISMVSRLRQLLQSHTSRVSKRMLSRDGAHGHNLSQLAETSGQLSHTDFRRPTTAMANGPGGLAISDNRSRTNAVVVLPDGIRLPAANAIGVKYHQNSKWSTPTGRTLSGSEYGADKEWHLRNMRYGDGWAYDSTHSHYKRAKPTHTDPEDDRAADPSMPMGSTSKTYDPRKDGNFWQRKDSGQEGSHSSSSTGNWRPRLRHETHFSSAAGDTSEASTAAHRLGSIHEAEGDAVKAAESPW